MTDKIKELIDAKDKSYKWFTGDDYNPAQKHFYHYKIQTEKMCLKAITYSGTYLCYVKNQTSELCLLAVKKDGLALQWVKEQTPEICMAAVKQNTEALKYVKKQTEDICLEAVKRWAFALQYVEQQTEAVCYAAYQQNPNSIIYFNDDLFRPAAKELTIAEIQELLGYEVKIVK